ncbi:MAG TPA: hypothetical protein VF384_11080 [Planctomycetota bacterium]
MNARMIALILAVALHASCSKEETPTPGGTPPQTGATAQPGGHDAMVKLGTVKLGELDVQVSQEGKLEAGKDLGFDLTFAKGTALPTVRAWVGIESGVGSAKALFEKDRADTLHQHVEVPKPLPEGSKLWLELDSTKTRASVDLHR